MLKNILLILFTISIFCNCNRKDINPNLPTCNLARYIFEDSVKTEFKYSNNKLVKETSYGVKSGLLLDSSNYQYSSGKVVKNAYESNGTLAYTETCLVNSNNDVILYTAIRYNNNQNVIFDTTSYTYDANGFLLKVDGDEWYIFTNPSFNDHYEWVSSYAYPSPGLVVITNVQGSQTTVDTIEYYTNLNPNPNSFQFSPYFKGKTDHLLIKKEGNSECTYIFDGNQNVIERKRWRNGSLDGIDEYQYDC